MLCPKCGAQLSDSAVICRACGAMLPEQPAATQVPYPPASQPAETAASAAIRFARSLLKSSVYVRRSSGLMARALAFAVMMIDLPFM